MIFDWPTLVAGAILGFFVHWTFVELKEYSERRKLRKAYGNLVGDYANFRVKDGTEEPTMGTVRLIWQSDGSFKVQGLHSNGVAEWESVIRMSLEFKNTGTGHYRYIGTDDSGTQQLIYSPETRSFIMTRPSIVAISKPARSSPNQSFRWKRIESR